MHELAHRHEQMMRLMVTALHYNSYEAECLELGERLRFARHYRESDAVWQFVALGIPTNLAKLVYVCWDHAFDRF